MNVAKRTFNPLLSKSFRYEQSEDAELVYYGNWGPTIQPLTISSSTWSTEYGDAEATDDGIGSTSTTTYATLSGVPGESKIINTVTLSDGSIDSRAILLLINDNSEGEIVNDYGYGL